jgi:predicted ATPase
MFFQVVHSRFDTPKRVPCILLERTDWDDHGYRTMFRAFFTRDDGRWTKLGRVKIMEKGQSSPRLSREPFDSLHATFCSLGQGTEYYDGLRTLLGYDAARQALTALRDIALNPAIEDAFHEERALKSSLLRFPNADLARAHARRVFGGMEEPEEKPLEFCFSCQLDGFADEHRIDFSFPTNKEERLGRIMAIAGRNGTGKTRLVARLAQVLSGLATDDQDHTFGTIDPERRTRVAVVSFNAFDEFTTPRNYVPGGDYSYYGLRSAALRSAGAMRSSEIDIARAFHRLHESIKQVWSLGAPHRDAWRSFLKQVQVFENEPGLNDPFENGTVELAQKLESFTARLRAASSGHQLLVFIVTALVESVRPKSVIVLDEPETHLHPRLLSTLLRLLYDMLVEREAYAVIATHSPIVLQEIPGRSIRLVRTVKGRYPLVKPYPRESFGESLDEIAREAFGVHEDDRSYATILRQFVDAGRDQAEIERLFDGLGLGARLLLRDLIEKRGAP